MKKKLRYSSTMSILIMTCFALLILCGCRGKKKKKNKEDEHKKSTEVHPVKDPIEYDFSCLEDEADGGEGKVIVLGNELENQALDNFGAEVTVEEEEEVGDAVYDENKKDIIENEDSEKLTNILERLVDQIKNERGFNYRIYLIKNDELNAWTCGGKIFVTTTMFDFCKSDDELACVIGHEINHNELGHIKHFIQKRKLLSDVGAGVSEILTLPFGQKDEAHCDLKGIDLVSAAGYDGCVNIDLWRRMKEESKEGDYNAFENLFRSHPYSAKRAICSENHIKNNYDIDCN